MVKNLDAARSRKKRAVKVPLNLERRMSVGLPTFMAKSLFAIKKCRFPKRSTLENGNGVRS